MKKLTSLVIALLLVLTFSACGSSNSNSSSSNGTNSNSSSSTSTKTKTTKSKGKVLVAYYSATGSTKAVAETIANATGGDLFEIEPKEPYSEGDLDWTNSRSRVSVEHDDESKRDVPLKTVTPENFDNYDTVFIGYPIWWGIAAWPVDNFVKGNDFTNKTVIPFCTSSSSGLGDSGELLKEQAGTGNWQDGERFSSGASQDEVESWVKDLGI
ncbi:flavodoxin [Ruminococcus bovis]|uniref:Flavodoxin n=1 Tax=Ruminococcus bovis TaxID=2564099 RepID=A0A4P8XXB5_9FIRM|nr:flavodoxin [Ruminococcus bovis]QCT07687.1 flavodoxin [Ruminococcus bovis]